MATIPTPRSYAQIVGDQLDILLSKLGLPSLRVGNPALSIIEAAAQSDLRSSQDIFNLLNSTSLDRATGTALDRIGADEDIPRIGLKASSGVVTISDTSFTKLQSNIFQGLPAPIIGAVIINVADALLFPASGSVYIGRGTTNYEGPIPYTSKTNNINYWTLNLSVGTQKYHNLGETVIVAQGGNRLIPAGSVVQTPQGNAGSSVQFGTLFPATIPDGETEITNVSVVAKVPGKIGNVIAGSIKAFATPPFVGASVTNPLPYTNGLETEDDNAYRERIRNERQSREKGTSLAITTGVIGITAPDENKTVISASVVTRAGYPTTLYIDDGTGYEESDIGIPYETIVDSALGGEQYFQLVNGRPVAKAYALTSLTAPFALQNGMTLSVLIGGILTQHTFSSSEFRAIGNASAYEVIASVNSDSNLLWNARTVNNGTQVAVFAKGDTNEDVQIIPPAVGFTDANPVLGFSAGKIDTLRLYKNDRLLSKDGQLAVLESNPQGLWGAMSSGETLAIAIDGIAIPLSLATFTDADFVNAGTAYTTVSATNSLDSWATVINYKIPGVTAAVNGGVITLTSNLGRNKASSVTIGACSLVSKGMFVVGSSQGKSFDYELDRNLGQIRLQNSLILATGDKLTAGSLATRAFIESAAISTITINSVATSVVGQNGAELWFVTDSNAQIVKTGLGPGTSLVWSLILSTSWGNRVRITSGTPVFINASIGNWFIVTDPAVAAANRGAWRIANIDTLGFWAEIEQPSTWASPQTVALVNGGAAVVNAYGQVRRVFIPASANYTATSLASAISIRGATASVFRTSKLRVRTNRFDALGDIALVAANSEGLKLTLPVSSAITNQTSHLGSILAANSEAGTPQFEIETIATVTDQTHITVTSVGQINSGVLLVPLKDLNDFSGGRYGNRGQVTPINLISGSALTLERPVLESWLPGDRLYAASHYALTGVDQLTALVDGDTNSKRFVMPTFRRCHPTTATYGATNTLQDKDNGNSSLALTFGTGMNWVDFAVFMRARTKSDQSLGADTNKTVLWRYNRLGTEGNDARIQYTYPTVPNAAVNVTANPYLDQYVDIGVQLPSGAARVGLTDSNSTLLGYSLTGSAGSGLWNYIYAFNLPIATGSRELRLNYTGRGTTVFSGTVTGGTTTFTATVVSDSLPGGMSGSGFLIITAPSGPFLNGETLTGTTGAGFVSGTQYGVAKLTLTNPPGVTNHGFVIGNQIFTNYNGTGTGAGFITGLKTILEVPSGTQINYIEGNTAIGSTASIGTVSNDRSPVGTAGSTVVAGDLFSVYAATSLPAEFQQSLRIQTITDSYIAAVSPINTGASTTLGWAHINSVNNIQAFPLNAGSSTIIAIVAAVNALPDSPVTAVAVGTGTDSTGSITYATYEAPPNGLGGTDPWFYLSDGLNYVRSTNTPALPTNDFIFTFKDPVAPSLATNSDWQNEDIRLVPITADNVTNYLNTAGPGGLFASGEIVTVTGGKPQITTLTVGSQGSVQIQGGTANALTSAILGSAVPVSSQYMVVNVEYSDTTGLSGGHWVKIQNGVAVPKARITSSTALTSIASDGTVILSGTTAWDWAGSTTGPFTGAFWQVEKQGNFVAFTYTSGTLPVLTGVSEGDFVHISNQLGGTVNVRNQGLYRIVRINTTNNIFWVANPNAAEEVSTVDLAFLAYDSIVPGDQLIINTGLWGLSNLGTWNVMSIDLTTYNLTNGNNTFKFKLDTSTRGITPQGAVAALGTSSGLIRVLEAAPSALYKRILSININANNPLLADVKFDTQAGYAKVNAAAGSIIYSLDKLGFPITLATGIDGYQHSIGLIAEANQVGYGNEEDTATYPGIIAAGAQVNIQGPLVRRIQVALALRVQTTSTAQDVEDQVRSAVASLINQTGVGQPIALSAIVDAAQSVNGITAVTILSPTYGSGNDLISIQPYEKPLVLSLNDDISISFVGE